MMINAYNNVNIKQQEVRLQYYKYHRHLNF